ncbi:MAG: ComF family protein [Candidatus Moranbacteria bacterium]|nr:ComF family protein [Candidatus Moranbacteria bacterium]
MSRQLKTSVIHSFVSDHANAAKRFLLDILFPLSCLGCGTDKTLLCSTCCSKLRLKYEQSCPYCRKHITPHGETCLACSDQNALDGVFVAYNYGHPLISTALHAFKYRSLESLAEPLSLLFIRAVSSSGLPLPDYIVPVPLHLWRLRYRGFNQSELLGRSLATSLLPGITISFNAESLIRHRFTLPQQKMPNATSRRHNIKNAFSVLQSAHSTIKGKSIWLIDDIATTSSTLDACARTLKRAGARKVFGVVFAQNACIPSCKKPSRKTITKKVLWPVE